MLKIHAPGFALPECARTDHEIVCAGHDGIDKLIHELRAIAAIAIEKHNDFVFRRKRAHSGQARATISGYRLRYDSSASFARAFRRSITAAIVDHDDLSGNFSRRHFANHVGNWFLLIGGRNDHEDGAHRKTSDALVK